MKRFLMSLLVFSGYSLVVYIAMVIVFGIFVPQQLKKNLKYILGGYGYLYTRLKEADRVKNVDVLVLGTSHAYRGYDPRIFAKRGMTMFNLGSSAQSILQTEALVNQYIDQLHPKLVLFDVYPIVIGSDGIESALDVISNSGSHADLMSMALKVNDIEVYNALIYSNFRQLMGLNANFKETLQSGNDTYIHGGYVQSFKKSKESTKKQWKAYKYSFNEKQIQALQRIVALFKSKNIKYMFLQAPLPVRRYAMITNNNAVDSLISGLGTYHNFNKSLALPDSMFADESHLNQFGVNVYDEEVIRKIDLCKRIAHSN